jgi:hypothetical protein
VINPFIFGQIIPPVVPTRGRKLTDITQVGLGFASVWFNFQIGLDVGLKDAAVGIVEGTWMAVTHPVDTVVNIVYAGAHPLKTARAIAQQIKEYCIGPAITVKSVGRCIGNAVGQIGFLVLTAGESGEVQVVAKGAEMADASVEAAQVADTVLIVLIIGQASQKASNLWSQPEKKFV